jgi:two-component system OmpR family sensor kinase
MTRSDPVAASEPAPGMADAFRTIAELNGDVAFILDCATGLPAYVSPAVGTMLGYDADDIRSDGPLGMLVAGLDERLRRFAGGDGSRLRVVREFELRRPDGREVAVEVVSQLMPDAAGQARLLAGVVRDISGERERARERKRFASMLNHEFRTPLSTIDGAIQRLEATADGADEPTRQRYRKIAAATDRLIAMLDDYLSPERMADVGRERAANTVSPRLLLEELVAQARQAGRPVQFSAEPLPATVRAEPAGMRMVLKILLDNILRYTPAGSGIVVTGRCVARGIALTLQDNGAGVPDGERVRIFDKGYRGSNAAGVPGSGLGLYMARSVVEVHGGTLEHVPVAGSGAEFRIWLPSLGVQIVA